MCGIGFTIKAVNSNHSVPTELAKFSERQVLPTRGLSAAALAESEVWMEGPAFKDDESTWPAAPLHGDDTKKTENCERRTTTKTHMTRSHASVIIDQTNSQASSVWFM